MNATPVLGLVLKFNLADIVHVTVWQTLLGNQYRVEQKALLYSAHVFWIVLQNWQYQVSRDPRVWFMLLKIVSAYWSYLVSLRSLVDMVPLLRSTARYRVSWLLSGFVSVVGKYIRGGLSGDCCDTRWSVDFSRINERRHVEEWYLKLGEDVSYGRLLGAPNMNTIFMWSLWTSFFVSIPGVLLYLEASVSIHDLQDAIIWLIIASHGSQEADNLNNVSKHDEKSKA